MISFIKPWVIKLKAARISYASVYLDGVTIAMEYVNEKLPCRTWRSFP